MTRLRRALAPFVGIWLFCQIGVITTVPVALWVTAADPHAEECTCGHDAGAMCPMHHTPTGEPLCVMQAVNSSDIAVLTSLVGVTGPLGDRGLTFSPAVWSTAVRTPEARVIGDRPIPPDPPPPRV